MPLPTNVIKGIRQTEKGTRLAPRHQFVLEVAKDANKLQIKQAVEELFQVSVKKVNTQIYQGKWKRLTGRRGQRPDWKKAIVTVAKGQKIELK